MIDELYTTRLQAGLGLIEETRKLLRLWSPDLSVNELVYKALDAGDFPNISFRRLRNIVAEGFTPRYLVNDGAPAFRLQRLMGDLDDRNFNQLLFLYTCRANSVLANFIREVYWPAYMAGKDQLSNDEARYFLIRANQDGKTTKPWVEGTVNRVASYLTGCCSDFGLLETGEKSVRKIQPFQIESTTTIYLAYDLHFAGAGDNSILSHLDWQLFGLDREDVLNEFKRTSLKGWYIIQTAGTATRIDWQYQSIEEVLDVITQE